MKAKIKNIRFVNNGSYDLCYITIDKTLDKVDTNGNKCANNNIVCTEYTAYRFNINESSVGKTISFDIFHHKKGDILNTPFNKDYIVKEDCVEYKINSIN